MHTSSIQEYSVEHGFDVCLQTRRGLSYMFLYCRTASSNGQCLTNIPTDLPIETAFVNLNLTGTFWSPDDQCRMIYGANASFCHVRYISCFQNSVLNVILTSLRTQ
jgi:hypothetical protein